MSYWRKLRAVLAVLLGLAGGTAEAALRAGAAAVDVSPIELPVIVNGGFTERVVDRVTDPLFARCVVIADDDLTLALVVVDSCMIPRDICDRIKAIAAEATGIPTDRMLVAATHTHSAPSVMNYCLGTRRDDRYTEYLVPRVAEAIRRAHARLVPAEAGWTVVEAPQHTHCRRWIRRPDRIGNDPFGSRTVAAMMHPGYENPDYLGPAGPVDTGLSMLSFRGLDETPICLFANYSMHYVGGVAAVSADYWGHFSRSVQERLGVAADQPEASRFVAIMSQGTSGDLHWMDYSRPRQPTTAARYADELAAITHEAYQAVSHNSDVDLAMAEATLELGRRIPSAERLRWAAEINAARGTRRPQNQVEVYAEQAEWIDKNPREELVLQAVRIGDVGITALPNEVFGVTGLRLKAASPLATTFNMELANGAAGYIPPPEQHRLGGYTTWPARTAGLEVTAEPQIVERLLTLLEEVSGEPRRQIDGDLYPAEIRANMQRALGGK